MDKDAKINREEKIIFNRKRLKTVAVTTAFMIAASSSLLALGAEKSFEIAKGKGMISNEFYEDTFDGLGYFDSTEGYSFNYNNNGNVEIIDFDQALDIITTRAENHGYNDVETYIALQDILPGTAAKDAVENVPTRDEIKKTAMEKYYESQLEKEDDYGKARN